MKELQEDKKNNKSFIKIFWNFSISYQFNA